MKQSVYLDYAAATPISDNVRSAMALYHSDLFYNPSALYLSAQSIKSDIGRARSSVAEVLGCKSSEIIFVAGGTEANNLAISGVMSQFEGKKVLVSAIEHESVIEPAGRFDSALISVDSTGLVDLAKLEAMIDDDIILISIMYVNNEIGTIQPIRDIVSLVNKVKQDRIARLGIKDALPLLLHTDACQAPNYLPVITNSLGVDLMTLNGGKVYGPKQSGVLFVKTGVNLTPMIMGGGQERNLRSGTENVANIIGFSSALVEANRLRDEEVDRLSDLQKFLQTELLNISEKISINGNSAHKVVNNIHFTVKDYDNERLLMELDEQGFMVATGSACSASNDEPSHVLNAIGLTDSEARSSIRLTMGRSTTKEALVKFVEALRIIVN